MPKNPMFQPHPDGEQFIVKLAGVVLICGSTIFGDPTETTPQGRTNAMRLVERFLHEAEKRGFKHTSTVWALMRRNTPNPRLANLAQEAMGLLPNDVQAQIIASTKAAASMPTLAVHLVTATRHPGQHEPETNPHQQTTDQAHVLHPSGVAKFEQRSRATLAASRGKGIIPDSPLWKELRPNLKPFHGQSRVRMLRAFLFTCNFCSCFKCLDKAVSGKKLLKKALILMPKVPHSNRRQRPRNAGNLAPSFWLAVWHQLQPIIFDHALDSGDVSHANQCVFDHLKNQRSLPFAQSHRSGLKRRVFGEHCGVYKCCQMCGKQLHRETRKTLPLSAEEGDLKVLTKRLQLSAARFVNATLQPSNDLSVEALRSLFGNLTKVLMQILGDTQGDAGVAVIVVHGGNFPPKQCHQLLTPKPCHNHNAFTTPKQCLPRSSQV